MTRIDFTSFDYHRTQIKINFPQLVEHVSYEFTSQVDLNYNCLAWALSYDNRYFDKGNGCYWIWDDAAPDTPEGWARVCEHHGFSFVPDNDASFVKNVEKIAILRASDGELHATRQSKDGKWKSKLGWGPDIDHTDLECLEHTYGKVTYVLQRQRLDWRDTDEAKAG